VTQHLEVFHWALVTADLERTAKQLDAVLGLTFAEAIDSRRAYSHAATGELSTPRVRVAYSRQGPPYLELIPIGSPGGSCSARDAGRIHHVGAWSDDVPGVDRQLLSKGDGSHYRVLDPASREIFAMLTAPRCCSERASNTSRSTRNPSSSNGPAPGCIPGDNRHPILESAEPGRRNDDS
jgi:hypothetical protein